MLSFSVGISYHHWKFIRIYETYYKYLIIVHLIHFAELHIIKLDFCKMIWDYVQYQDRYPSTNMTDIQGLIRDEKYSQRWHSRQIFSHANNSWFTVYRHVIFFYPLLCSHPGLWFEYTANCIAWECSYIEMTNHVHASL